MRPWRLAALVLGAVLAGLAALGVVLYLERHDLAWFLADPEAPAAAPRRKPAARPPEAPPAPTLAPPPAERSLSWEGLTVAPCAGDPCSNFTVKRTLDRLDQDLLDAVKDLKDASGLFPARENRVTIVPLPRKECPFVEPFAVEGGTPARVQLPMEPLVLGWWRPRQVLSAALAEGILRQEAPAYARAPAWVRAGIALQLSDFGALYAARVLVDTDKAPLLLVRPLGETGEAAWLDGYWAVKALSARKGDGAVRAWVEAMRAGLPWDEALKKGAGETPEAFDSQYQTWTAAYLRDLCVNRQALLDAVALLRQQKEKEALPLLEDLVKNRPLDLYNGNARYYLNYARYRHGDYDRAVDGFTDLLVNFPATTSLQGKAYYFLGRSYQLSGYAPLAEKAYTLAALDPDNALLVKLARQHLEEVK